MTIAVENAYDNNDQTLSGVTTISDVVVTSANKILVAVSVRDATDSDRPVSSITRDGQSFTQAIGVNATGANNTSAEIWYLDSPNTGTADIVITFDGVNGFVGSGAVTLTDAASGGPDDTDDSGTGETGANPTATLASSTGGISIACIAWDNAGGPTESGTELYNVTNTNARHGQYTLGGGNLTWTRSAHAHSYVGAVWATDAGGGATAEPATVAATSSIPAATVSAGVSVTPATVAATASVGAPTPGAGAGVAPATVAATASVPAPTVSSDAAVAPDTVAATSSVPVPSVSAGGSATAMPVAVAATVTVPAPSVSTSTAANATPATVAATVTVPAPSVSAAVGATATPDTVAATTSVPAPTVTAGGGVNATPATVAVTVTIPAPSVSAAAGATATPAAIDATVTVPTPTVAGNVEVTPDTIALAASVLQIFAAGDSGLPGAASTTVAAPGAVATIAAPGAALTIARMLP